MAENLLWLVGGLLIIPAAVGVYAFAQWVRDAARRAWTRPRDLQGKSLAVRRSVVTMVALELLDARHVRAVRLPFNRLLVIRSNPKREYDWDSDGWILVGDDYENAAEVFGRALDELGYAVLAEQGEQT